MFYFVVDSLMKFASMAYSSSGDSYNSAEVIDVQEPKFLCPLCLRSRIFFYCEKCIRNGSFTHSEGETYERFADKKLQLYRLNERKDKLLKRYQGLLSDQTKAENLKLEIASYLQSNRHLKACIKQVKEKIKSTLKSADSIRHRNELFNNDKPKFIEKISLMKRKLASSMSKIEEDKTKLEGIETSMKQVRKESIQQLVIYIFPISKVKATHTTTTRGYLDPDDHLDPVFVTGQWELAGLSSDCDFQYKIIESCVPANGNYSAYLDWSSKMKQEMPLEEEEEDTALRDTAYSILTALSFASHLLTVLCFYLDVHVPKRLTPSEFNCTELSEQVFLHKVAKLNANVVYLCLLQNVNPAHIRPHHTIENLLLLLDPSVSDLGRSGPLEVTQRLPPNVECCLASELLPEDDDDDNDGIFDELCADWVKIKPGESDDDEHMVVCEFGTMTDQPQYVSHRSSVTGELMSSMSYLWKVATWQK